MPAPENHWSLALPPRLLVASPIFDPVVGLSSLKPRLAVHNEHCDPIKSKNININKRFVFAFTKI